jgi:tetratricopeptide (TPR) repeat protein
MGQEMFNHDRYDQAKFCFSRAKLPDKEAQAAAYLLEQKATAIPEVQLSKRKRAFIKAANAFVLCITDFDAPHVPFFRRAANCFEAAGDWHKAAVHYEKGKAFDLAALLYLKSNNYDAAINLVSTQKIKPDLKDRIVREARLYYFTHQRMESVLLIDSLQVLVLTLPQRWRCSVWLDR